jgi:hypothetical protein
MPQLFFLGSQISFSRSDGFRDARHAFHYKNSRTLDGLHFLRIVRKQAHGANAEMPQNGARQIVIAEIGIESKLLIGFHRICSVILQLVGPQLVQQADSTAFLQFVDHQSAAFLGNGA